MDNLNIEKENITQYQSQVENLTDDDFDIWNYIRFISEERWLISGVTIIILLIGFIYAFNATPIYRTDALLQVEETKTTMQGLDEISAAFGGGIPAVTEIEVIRSRSVIGPAVDRLGLAIIVRPRYFPLFGKNSARKHKKRDTLAKPVWTLSSYAWGGERLEIQQLELPKRFIGQSLLLVALKDSEFRLYDQNGDSLIEGKVGELKASEIKGGGSASIFVRDLFARPGTEFDVVKLSRSNILRNLQARLGVSEKGWKTGILELIMEGANPVRITNIVNTIANTYLRQNAERRSAEAESTLQFLNKQLPTLKSKLDAAESNLSNYRSQTGNINLTLETKSLLESVTKIEKQIQELILKKSEIKQRYTQNHPVTRGIDLKLDKLKQEKSILNKRIKALPEVEQFSVQFMRDVKVANELYLLLLNKAQELKVIKAGTIGNVRILDIALVPEHPIKPRKFRIILISIILGLIGGVSAAFIRQNLIRGITDPNWLESHYGIPVYATILHSKKLKNIENNYARAGKNNLPILVSEDSKDLSIEGLRSFRTSLQFAMMESKNNIIAISGSSPQVGKSFISVNLPFVLSDTDKNVLIIDGDMRRGHIHRYFSADRSPGLSEYISGNAEIKDILRKVKEDKVSYITSGEIPPNPSELLTSDRFSTLLDKLNSQFDVVLIDTPPILAVTDGIIISHLAGALFLVLKSGLHHPKEIESMLRRLSQNSIQPNGFILNDVPIAPLGKYGYKYNYYNYNYKY